jgi:Uma2 family endonuclease
MSVAAKNASRSATLEELLAMPEEERYEIVDGELLPKEAGSGKHGGAQGRTFQSLAPFNRRPGGPPERPGGWWFATEALISFSPRQIRRPDIAGWRRDRLPELPAAVPITVLPDWICEILSPTNASNDTIKKMRLYHQARVPHYWLIDPIAETLAVYRDTPDGYLNVLIAERGERVRAEPFAAIELPVGVFFGDDEE